jgi:hypothetical protein
MTRCSLSMFTITPWRMAEPQIANRGAMRLRSAGAAAACAVLGLLLMGTDAGLAQTQVPPPPTDVELLAGSDSSISISWDASPGATSYNVYRGTSPGLEDSSPIANTTSTTYTDGNLSAEPIYFYQVTALNAAGESARTREDASKTPPPVGTGGNVAGVPSGNGMVYYGQDALLGGFDWFQELAGWFPQVLYSSGSTSPTGLVTDMAYSTRGTMTFNSVVVPTSGLYTVDWRYAFDSGAFPGITNRQMGLRVNGQAVTTSQRFIITGSFDVYQHSLLQVNLNAGVNSISLFAVSDHGVARIDQMTITPASASVPSAPTNLTATAPECASGVNLSWTPSGSGNPTSYGVYRGALSDGEDVTPIGTTPGSTTSFTDTEVQLGTIYFYDVVGNNSVGISPSSNEVSVALHCGTL